MRRGGIEKGMRRKELKEGLEGEDLNGERKVNGKGTRNECGPNTAGAKTTPTGWFCATSATRATTSGVWSPP